MKFFGAFKAARFALALTFAMPIFGTIQLTTSTLAEASPARLAAIKRVEGMHERKNRKAIQAMVGINPSTTPWCGAAAAYAVRKAGGKPVAGHNKAINWTKFGKGVSLASARKGDIVVLRFKRGYHVGIYSKNAGNGRIEICGGNMSDRFKCSNYRASNVKAVRR
ncbi:MAG: TIGR02594 family protein [Salaquimonas sp.]